MTPASMLLCAALSLPATSQSPTSPQQISTTVLLRCGPSDITLNEGIVEALLNQPETRQPFRKEFGDAFAKLEGIDATFYGGHANGTYQIHIDCTVRMGGDWSSKKARSCKHTIAAYLQQRLSDMLYLRPLAELRKQRQELEMRMVDLQTRLAELEARDSGHQTEVDRLREQQRMLQHQLLEVELEAATEEHARAHLAKMREQNIEMRDQLRESLTTAVRERDDIKGTLNPLNHRLAMLEAPQGAVSDPKGPTAKALRKQVTDLKKALAKVQRNLSGWQEIQNDVNNLLTIVLEQLPACELALQRARARLTSLRERLDQNRAQASHLTTQTKKISQRAIERQRLEIDLQVARERLLEIEAQVARMQPVRYELLH